MRLKIRKEEGASSPYIEVPGDDVADVLGDMERRSEGWAVSFIRSLEGAPDDVISMLPLSVVEKVLEGAAKSQGDIGTLAKVALRLLKSCMEEK